MAPMDYIGRYGIAKEKLAQQFIDAGITTASIDDYDSWLNDRANTLAIASNAFLSELEHSL